MAPATSSDQCGGRVNFEALPNRVGIVGSRKFSNSPEDRRADRIAEKWVRIFVQRLKFGTVIVSGGAAGVDSWAESEAIKRGDLPIPEVYSVRPEEWRPPSWGGKVDHSAGLRRNTRIVGDLVDNPPSCLVAFVVQGPKNGMSSGTADTVAKAIAAKVPTLVYILTDTGDLFDVRVHGFRPYLKYPEGE